MRRVPLPGTSHLEATRGGGGSGGPTSAGHRNIRQTVESLRLRGRVPTPSASHPMEEECVAGSDDRRGIAGISLGGIIVIVGIMLMFVWSFWIGLIIALVGLVAFGGFTRGKWY
jgi:hypothetical protein